MRRCANCEFENGADATACARCGQPLGREGGVATASRGEMPAWLSSLQPGAAKEGGEDQASTPAGGAVAAAAALPIQVRRSRVPVLSVDAPRAAAQTDRPGASAAPDAGSPLSSGVGAGAGALTMPSTAGRNRQRLLLLLLLIVAIITVLVLRHALP